MKNNKYAIIEGWLSLIGNILLFALKYWAGIVSGSVAIIADAWHTLSDSISSVILLIGVKISNKPADKNHPFGHGRAEIISSLIIGILLSLIGFNFIVEATNKLINKETANFGTLVIVVTIISMLFKELNAQYAFWAAKKTKMNSLKADALHHRSDSISSLVILIGIIFGKSIWWIDGALGIVVALIIFYSSYEVIKEAIKPLMGESPDNETNTAISKIIKQNINIKFNFHHLHIHNYGNHTEITFHLKLDKKMDFEEAHNIASLIEEKIKNELDIIATIHMEPF